MSEPDHINDRVTTLEQQMSEVRRDATNAVNMARALDRDSADSQERRQSDLKLFHALRETQVEQGQIMREGFKEMRRGFSTLRGGMTGITELLNIAHRQSKEDER